MSPIGSSSQLLGKIKAMFQTTNQFRGNPQLIVKVCESRVDIIGQLTSSRQILAVEM